MTPIQTRHDPTDPAALLEVSLVSLLMVRMLARVDYFARLVITVFKCFDGAKNFWLLVVWLACEDGGQGLLDIKDVHSV